MTLPARAWLRLLGLAGKVGIAGGAVYDALIGATAHHAGATLLMRNRRATAVYEKLRISYELVF